MNNTLERRPFIATKDLPLALRLEKEGIGLRLLGFLDGKKLYLIDPGGLSLDDLRSSTVSARSLQLINEHTFVPNQDVVESDRQIIGSGSFEIPSVDVVLVLWQDSTAPGKPYYLVPKTVGDDSIISAISGYGPDGIAHNDPLHSGQVNIRNSTAAFGEAVRGYEYSKDNGETDLLWAVPHEDFVDAQISERLEEKVTAERRIAALFTDIADKHISHGRKGEFSAHGLIVYLLRNGNIFKDEDVIRAIVKNKLRSTDQTALDQNNWFSEEEKQGVIEAAVSLARIVQDHDLDPRQIVAWMADLIAHRTPSIPGVDKHRLIADLIDDNRTIVKVAGAKNMSFEDAQDWLRRHISDALKKIIGIEEIEPATALMELQRVASISNRDELVEVLESGRPLHQAMLIKNKKDKEYAAEESQVAEEILEDRRNKFIATYLTKYYPNFNINGKVYSAADFRRDNKSLVDLLDSVVGNELEAKILREVEIPLIVGKHDKLMTKIKTALREVERYEDLSKKLQGAITTARNEGLDDIHKRLDDMSWEKDSQGYQIAARLKSQRISDLDFVNQLRLINSELQFILDGVANPFKTWNLLTSRASVFSELMDEERFVKLLWGRLTSRFRVTVPGFGNTELSRGTPDEVEKWLNNIIRRFSSGELTDKLVVAELEGKLPDQINESNNGRQQSESHQPQNRESAVNQEVRDMLSREFLDELATKLFILGHDGIDPITKKRLQELKGLVDKYLEGREGDASGRIKEILAGIEKREQQNADRSRTGR